jgi:hypothetical protein
MINAPPRPAGALDGKTSMTNPDDLRAQIRQDTAELDTLTSQRDVLRDLLARVRDTHKATNAGIRIVMARRDRRIKRARELGLTTEELVADTGLTAPRVRQLAPGRPTKLPTPPPEEPSTPIVDLSDIVTAVQELTSKRVPARACASTPARRHTDHAPAPTLAPVPARRRTDRAPHGAFSIESRVKNALVEHQGDTDAAIAALVKTAIPDAMQLLDACRIGSTYDYTAHPSIPDPLKRPGKKQPDQIWEGRPRYTNPGVPDGEMVTILDMNAAYLAALRRVHLPIGKLVNTREIGEDPAVYNRKRSGIYLIEPSPWGHATLPNPLGDGREQDGPVWVTDATVRLMLRAAKLLEGSGYQPPRILESFTSGSTENMLVKFGDVMADARRAAIDQDDAVTLEYVKAMYAKFVSTCGDSGANHDIYRPDWVHIIRSQAFANLWYKAHKAWTTGLTVYRMSGTDELHVIGAWREARWLTGVALFPEGRDLTQVKVKGTYVTGGDRA